MLLDRSDNLPLLRPSRALTFWQTGLVPSNYLQEVDDEGTGGATAPPPAAPEPAATPSESKGATATALYDYEAGEDNELSFPEDAVISNIVSSPYGWRP